MNKVMNTRTTAFAEYDAEAKKIAGLLAKFEAAKAQHFDKAVRDQKNWGYHGDIVAAREYLELALERLGGAA